MVYRPFFGPAAFAAALVGLAGVGGDAAAQTMNANAASYNAGYGRLPGRENQPVSQTMRNAAGGLISVDGWIDAGTDQSTFSNGGAGDTAAGAGARDDSGFGADVSSVVVSDQATDDASSNSTNHGKSSAAAALNGGVGDAQ
ncbi:MAG: endonuclease [Caulobacteraceae bacterium]|nr:endonuclease [Caulobacteraceae bacterium]